MNIFIILGGFVGFDGSITSLGMMALSTMIQRRFNITPKVYDWGFYKKAEIAIKQSDSNIVITYSGGGSRLTWMQEPPISLAIFYDPSPSWQIINPLAKSIKRAVVYENSSPLFFGLGGGKIKGDQVEVVPIKEWHPLVQSDNALHLRTLQEIQKII